MEATTPRATAESRFNALKTDREPYLRRARRLARLTIPSLFRDEGDTGQSDEIVPWQSFGAYAANNLSNKIMLSLFPAGVPWIKLKASRDVVNSLQQMDEADRGLIKSQIAGGLSTIEQEFVEGIEEDGDRTVLSSAVKSLVVGGNHAIQLYDDGFLRGIPLQRYVTLRDPSRLLLEFVIHDPMDYFLLEKDVQDLAVKGGFSPPEADERGSKKGLVNVYTHGWWNGKRFIVKTEVMGQTVEGSEMHYTRTALPYMFLMFDYQEDEHYGRSYVEHYEADLQSLDGMEQIVQEGTAMNALMIRLVRPGGVTSKRAIEQAMNGAVLSGNAEDVSTVQGQKNADLASAGALVDRIIGRLSRAFLLNSSVQRQAERVTKAEIKVVSQELEDQLGAAYASQVTSFQAPYARLKLKALQRGNRVTPVPDRSVTMVILTGAAALGRMAEIQLLDIALQGAIPTVGPEFILESINPRVYMNRRFAALGVQQEGLVLTEEELAAKQQQDQLMGLAQSMGPEVIKQAGNVSAERVGAEQETQQGA